MACFVRAVGIQLDVDSLLDSVELPVDSVYRRGEPRNAASRVLNEMSGVVIRVSDAGFTEFEAQVEGAIRFVRLHAARLERLARFPGVEGCYIDFGVVAAGGSVVAQFHRFPVELLGLLSRAGLALEISFYPVGAE